MITEQQKEQFLKDGYLVVENVIDSVALNAVRSEYEQVIRENYQTWYQDGKVSDPPEGLTGWDMIDRAVEAGVEWYQPLDISLPHADIREDTPFHFGPSTFDLITHKNVLSIAETLLGGELTSNPIQHVRIKPPQREVSSDEVRAHIVATDWHQDRGVGLEEADNTDMITVWLAITDANINNGCLQVIPNPPEELLPHCPKTQTAMADPFIEADRAIPVEVKAGGAVIIHPLTPHCAGPNQSDGYRWSFDIRFNVTGQPTGREQFPDFVALSRKSPESELRDWTAWKESWETTRKTLASSEHIPQHRWDSSSPHCA